MVFSNVKPAPLHRGANGGGGSQHRRSRSLSVDNIALVIDNNAAAKQRREADAPGGDSLASPMGDSLGTLTRSHSRKKLTGLTDKELRELTDQEVQELTGNSPQQGKAPQPEALLIGRRCITECV